MKSSTTLQGHVALVTGASSGIGSDIARELASRGADLVLAARRRSKLEALGAELQKKYGTRVTVIEADLSKPTGAQELFSAATREGLPPVTILVNNAGLGFYGPFLDCEWEQQLQTITVNSTAVTELLFRFARSMKTHARPSYILNVSSIGGFQASPGLALYCGTKHFVRAMSEAVALELIRTNVSVSCLCPGGTRTEFLEKAGEKVTAQGEWAMMDSPVVARIAVDGMLRKQDIIVPGFLNILAVILPRILPRRLALRVAYASMSRSVERVEIPKGPGA